MAEQGEACKHCGGVDNWHHDLTVCVGALKSQLAEATAQLTEERSQNFELRKRVVEAHGWLDAEQTKLAEATSKLEAAESIK